MDPRYPLGRFVFDSAVTTDTRAAHIAHIEALPSTLTAAVVALLPDRLDRPYREGGWTARQVVHHLADSHINAYVRVRLALTEDRPALKTYEEQLWAELPDARTLEPEVSLGILRGVHQRWVVLLRSLDEAAFARTGRHPASGEVSVDWLLQSYSWHGRHHVGHIGLCRTI